MGEKRLMTMCPPHSFEWRTRTPVCAFTCVSRQIFRAVISDLGRIRQGAWGKPAIESGMWTPLRRASPP